MVILGSAAVALHNLPPDVPLYDDLVMITEAGNRAADLTRQLLAYVGQGPFEIVPLDLSALLEQHSGAFRSAVGADANLHLDLDPSLPAIAADATQVYRVAVNLILNASEALVSREETIRVSTGVIELSQAEPATSASDAELPAGSYVYLEVADTGVGMDTKTRARLFEPFFTTRFPGRGLGLAAVQGIMRRHGGAVRVSSAPGEGTTMRALFPVPARQQV
jgi:signal transduction histidine kinase